MAGNLPIVCIFGVENIELESLGPVAHFETTKLDCRCYLTDDNLHSILAKVRPDVIVSFGEMLDFPNLTNSQYDVRKRWINFEDTQGLADKGMKTFWCYIRNAVEEQKDFPLVSVFTPAYKTGDKIMRPYHSLIAQTYSNWEWVIIDDSDDDGETWEMLQALSNKDGRIRIIREKAHCGVIGKLKRLACKMSEGEYLVELDHDDELLPHALDYVVKAYQKYPEVGFVYTDFAESFEDGSVVTYGDNWGFGYGSYREERHNGVKYMVVNAPNINPKTIRHIVAAPNHIRSWRATSYWEIGGHSSRIHVADDYEIMVRTFLGTRMCRVPRMCYIQYRNEGGNTHKVRNQEIQRLVRYFSNWYNEAIHQRFIQLGVNDFVYEGDKTWINLNQVINPKEEPHCTILADI